ncbi:hypothetical protein PHYBOEH_010802 [Phytophthora boehmeriae]|uniref:Uncharacterized protein n=1 Tax=Phytophthora boehmeriae TaxID=109152 RepID=A0A8T1VLD6_9STRA|nr:hypothetical protein PHYBOEH_010802 [Phytophthora boehmeriae]
MVVPRASIDGDEVQCTDGTLLKTSLGDPNFVICAAGASGFTAYSRDMAVGVEYMDRSIKTMSAPEVTDQSASCNRADDDYTSVTSTGLALLTGNTIPAGSSRNLKEATHIVIDEETCSCKSTPRPCIFFHGLGNPNEEAELQDSPKKTKRKMGEIKGHAPCCSTIKYAVLNTVDYAWTNSTLQQKFCDHALSISDTSDLTSMTIEDTVIVTHSMGGLVMAGALANEKCKFGENTFWASLSAPMTGTMTVDYLQDFCNGEKGKFMVEVLDLIGECPVSTSRKSISYQNEKYSSPELNAAYIAAQEAYRGNVTAALCSNHYAGVVSLYQVPAIVAGKIIPHKSREGDGYVEFQSCAGGLPASMFGNSYKDKFYATELNHADTAFLTHDGLFKDSQKPAKWFECLL